MNGAPDVSRETRERLDNFVALLLEENARQNLIAKSTEADIWDRHINDSIQLLQHAPAGRWLDIGSGAGLPGLVVAIMRPDQDTVLVEPRAKRAAFLADMAERLALPAVRVIASRVEAVAPLGAAIISARAVASLSKLFEMAIGHAAADCTWLLSKGRGAATELAEARQSWQGRFDLIPSETDPEAAIVMARDIEPLRPKRTRR